MYPKVELADMGELSRDTVDEGYDPEIPQSADRLRWLEILESYDIPLDTWAAHMTWVYAWYSWEEAEEYAKRAHQAWEEFNAGLRTNLVV